MREVVPHSPEGVISGSFKFKPEIDAAITEFRDLNVIIRAPEVGWLYKPNNGLIVVTNAERFQPLPTEQHMMAGEVEAEFLDQLDKSDFVYVINPGGYIGDMSIFEIGYAHGIRKQIYASNQLNFDALGIRDPKMIDLLRTSVAVMPPAAAAQDMHRRLTADLTNNYQDEVHSSFDQLTSQRSRIAAAIGNIAEGAIMRHNNRLLLVEDGSWNNERLTIPGTRVRVGERRAMALERPIAGKMGVEVTSLAHFATNFMLPDSGYKKPVNTDAFVFDDHIADLRTEQIKAKRGIVPTWVTNVQAESLIDSGQVEPNAAKLITHYLQTAA